MQQPPLQEAMMGQQYVKERNTPCCFSPAVVCATAVSCCYGGTQPGEVDEYFVSNAIAKPWWPEDPDRMCLPSVNAAEGGNKPLVVAAVGSVMPRRLDTRVAHMRTALPRYSLMLTPLCFLGGAIFIEHICSHPFCSRANPDES